MIQHRSIRDHEKLKLLINLQILFKILELCHLPFPTANIEAKCKSVLVSIQIYLQTPFHICDQFFIIILFILLISIYSQSNARHSKITRTRPKYSTTMRSKKFNIWNRWTIWLSTLVLFCPKSYTLKGFRIFLINHRAILLEKSRT